MCDRVDEREVRVHDAGPAQLVSFDRDRDLEPLVTACCSYTLTPASDTALHYDYDFTVLQASIVERFVRGRCLINPQVRGHMFCVSAHRPNCC